jgi:hypothetical protein
LAHSVHDPAPPTDDVPATQSLQPEEPRTPAYMPGGQNEHLALLLTRA